MSGSEAGRRPCHGFLLSADRVIIGHRGKVLEEAAVLVVGEKLAWVGHTAALPEAYRSVRQVPLPGCTLLPGLIEGHAHLCLDGGTAPFDRFGTAGPEEVVGCAAEALRRMARAGVTTVRDMGAPAFLAEAFQHGTVLGEHPGPRVLHAGVPVTSPGGHCAVMGGEAADAGRALALIDANRRSGADWTKLMVTGGFLSSAASSPYRTQFPQHLLDSAVRTSHARAMKVAAHAHGVEGVRAAVAAGVDTVEHCTWMDEGGFRVDAALISEMSDRGTVVSVTVNSRARAATGRLPWHERRSQLAQLHTSGVPLIAGTDCGIGNTPHDDLPASLDAYIDFGMSPIEVIEAATGTNARLLGLAPQTGTLTPGGCADILAVHGDPLESLAHLTDVACVLVRGRPVVEPSPQPSSATALSWEYLCQ
ncbi:amidohydrolase family protein [Streptomyces sp. SID8361]|uniref:amidohydrolase family protein n=1 Tax=Streptomyces sp. MnatMP-M27 TaxID=1839768 RepID=UPI00081E77C2|nr:amidohydrolase family protein [Streptomyces sp. MnatMP-M27]MYU12630.1 amidohydrolase family protein [Streptomyces sp. SID8361]SCF93548.1 Imidazolonepropionase [Streptomyces sp. MnatMP-M27]